MGILRFLVLIQRTADIFMMRKDRVLLHYHISHRLHSSLCVASYSLTNGTCRTTEGKRGGNVKFSVCHHRNL